MVPLVSLLIGTQILCSLAGHPPYRESPPPPPDRLISPPCNSSSVKTVAELALDKLNEHRKEGYVLGLQRIFDVRQLQWQDTGVVYYLTLDVLETECHVLSRKSWKDCQFRQSHETIYGQCKATFYINKPWRILQLYNYDCVLRPMPATTIARVCPDCPVYQDPKQPRIWEAANQSLAKFNAESHHTHYFNIREVSRASMQWVVGPAYFVEYAIQETSCSKSQPLEDLSKCPFLPEETADVGVCKGSEVFSQIEHRKFIEAKCEIFHPRPHVSEEEQTGNRKPGHQEEDGRGEDGGHSEGGRKGHHDGHSEGGRGGDRDGHSEGGRGGDRDGHSEGGRGGDRDGHSEGGRGGDRDGHSEGGRGGDRDGHSGGRRGGHHDHHQHHPHDRRHHKHHRHHKNDSHDHVEHGQDPPTSDTFETSTHLEKTVGRVIVVPSSNTHVSLHSLPDIEAERLDGVPVPPQSQEPKLSPSLPDIHGAPDERRPLGRPMGLPSLAKPVRPVTPPPFPAGFSQSDTCPGEILVSIYGLEPLLPQRPVELSPTAAPEFQVKVYGQCKATFYINKPGRILHLFNYNGVLRPHCNSTEKDAGVALDLINKHRRDGYVFSLLRVADAHVQLAGNGSIFYFTLDVLETECPVISRKYWETCGYGSMFGTSDFGRCNAVIYINQLLQKERLYGYNCTMSPVPPQLYECKRCPVRITVLDNVQQYAAEAERVLERYNEDSNQTNYFKLDQVMKVLLGEADRTGYQVEFTIQETTCPKTKVLPQMSGCEFLPDREAHTGFCTGRVLNGTKDLEGVEVLSCEIYDIQLGSHPVDGHAHNDSGESHHHCNVSGHGCRHPWRKPHHLHHHHPCHPSHHHHHHHHTHHHHPPSHHHHHRPHHHHHHHHHHLPHHHHHHPHHDHYRHRHCHGHHPCGSEEPTARSNSSEESQGKDYPDVPPPPGPRYPPPPPGGPHHFPPSRFPPPPAGPPPPPSQPFRPPPHHHHPEGPNFRPPPPSPCGPCCSYHHDHQRNDTWHERREDKSSKERGPFQDPHSFPKGKDASVYRLPLASERDVLQVPGADFSSPSHDRYKEAVAQPFPLTPSESESCPGKPTFDLPFDLLSLYPPPPPPTH